MFIIFGGEMDRDGKEASAAEPQHTEAAHWVIRQFEKVKKKKKIIISS